MKKSFFTHRTVPLILKSMFTVALFVISLYLTRCLYINIRNVGNLTMAFMTVLSAIFTIGSWGWFSFTLKSLVTRITITDKEVYLTRYGRRIVSVSWDAVVEVGIGAVTTPKGDIQKLYFAERPLTEIQKRNLDLAQKDCVYFSSVPAELFELLARYSPLPLPEEAEGLQRKNISVS